jgi:hypothetical protein
MSATLKPPGLRWLKQLSTRTKWLILAPVSLVLIGFGLSVFSEAGWLKHSGAPFWRWVLWGTYSLILINAGLCLLGEAIRYRVMLDTRRAIRKAIKKKQRRQRDNTSPNQKRLRSMRPS